MSKDTVIYAVNRTTGEIQSQFEMRESASKANRIHAFVKWRNQYMSYCTLYTKNSVGHWLRMLRQSKQWAGVMEGKLPRAMRMLELMGME